MEYEKSMFDEFVSEARELLETIEEDFLNLEKQKERPDPELINKVFRAIHTIKGLAGFLGLNNMNRLSHVMETILSTMRSGDIRPEMRFVNPLLEGVDVLNAMLDDVEHSNEMDITRVYGTLSSLLVSEAPSQVMDALSVSRPLADLKGKDIGFDVSEFAWKDIPASEFLYVLKYDLMEFARHGGRSPVALIRHLVARGAIIDGRIHTVSEDLRDGLPDQPLDYDVLYSTAVSLSDIYEVVELPPARVIQVRKDIYVTGGKEGYRVQGAEGRSVGTSPCRAEWVVDHRDGEKIVPVIAAQGAPHVVDEVSKMGGIASANVLAAVSSAQSAQSPIINQQPAIINRQSSIAEAPMAPDVLFEAARDDEARISVVPASARERSGTIRINVEILDALMTLAGELVLVRNQQLLNVDRSDSVSRSIMQRLDIVTSELQETIMRTRMQPMSNVFGKFSRIVRDLGNKLGKQIDIAISGNEVELDKTILESLADPLTHLVRNCCDHGIETPDERVKAGKPEIGHIALSAYHEGGQINIEIVDDGKGINIEAVKRKILEKRLKTEVELAQMGEKEIISFIMLPGFSTVEKVSDVSGRGVGMDVVRSNIEKLGGIIDIESAFGKGMRIHLRLPLTLAIIPCLIVTVGEYRYAIPQVNLVELVCLYDDDVRTKIESIAGREVYRLRDYLLPMVRLSETLARPIPFTDEIWAEITEKYRQRQATEPTEKDGKGTEITEKYRSRGEPVCPSNAAALGPNGSHVQASQSLNFAVLKVGKRRMGLIVDRIIGTEEIVVKPMHPALKSLGCYSGATIMGDGKVSLILDVEGIARHTGIAHEGSDEETAETVDKEAAGEVQSVLLFKNGEKEQFAISLPFIKRIERITATNIEQIGEKGFITVDGVSTFILRLDNYLKVSPCVEKAEMYLLIPKGVKKPFGILVSTLIDIVETPVELNVESYMEDSLLGTAIVRDRMTLFVDILKLIEKAEPSCLAEDR